MKYLFVLLLATFAIISCTKDNEASNNEETICMNGRMNWGGDPIVDGSGWTFVRAETNEHYYLKDLPEMYKQHNLQVSVCAAPTDEKIYYFAPEPKTAYKIISINKR